MQDRLRLIDQIVHEPPAPPRQLDRRIPRDLETIVLKALAKDPKDRFATADELAAELRRFLENRPIRSRPISASERLWRWCKRNPAVAALNALAAALTIFIAIGSTVAAWTFRGQRNEVRFEQGRTKASLSRAEHAEREAVLAEHEAQLALGQSLVSEGAALQRTGLIGQRFDSLDRLGKAAQVLGADPEGRKRLPEIRNHAIAALGLTDLRVRRQRDYGDVFGITSMPPWSGTRWPRGPARWSCAGWTTTASWSACRGRTSGVSGMPGLPSARTASCWWLATAWVVGAIYCGYGTWDAGSCSGACRAGDVGRSTPTAAACCSMRLEGGIAVWDRVERRVVRRLPLDFTPNDLALDPEGRRLAVNNTDEAAPRVAILELETGRVLADWRSQVGNGAMAWSADGQLLAVGSHVGMTPASTSGTSAAGAGLDTSGAHRRDRRRPVRALGLPAGDRKLGRHDPALGRGLGGAPGDRAG